ncbi:MAG: hypothetical protein DRN06_02975 [Thermoprotei archaeon]|nr:MAG: hypothetical protein DRN06_02975 [Thermoprotei archaeon]
MGTYATVDEVRDFSGVPAEKVSDAELERYIAMAEDFIDSYTGTTWKTKTTEEYFDGDRKVIHLSRYPVQDVTEVKVIADRSENIDEDVTITDYILIKEIGVLRFKSKLPKGISNVKVSYVYGYNNVTGEVKEACIILATILAKLALRGKANPYELRRFVFGSEVAEFNELTSLRERAAELLDLLSVRGGVVFV